MMDTNFFQTDMTCIESWRTVIDNLMTHDRTTFKDLLGQWQTKCTISSVTFDAVNLRDYLQQGGHVSVGAI